MTGLCWQHGCHAAARTGTAHAPSRLDCALWNSSLSEPLSGAAAAAARGAVLVLGAMPPATIFRLLMGRHSPEEPSTMKRLLLAAVLVVPVSGGPEGRPEGPEWAPLGRRGGRPGERTQAADWGCNTPVRLVRRVA